MKSNPKCGAEEREWGRGWGILSLIALDCFVANKAPKLTFVYRKSEKSTHDVSYDALFVTLSELTSFGQLCGHL